MGKRALKLLFGLLILAVLFWRFEPARIIDELAASDPFYILLALAITPVTMYLRAARLQRLLMIHGRLVPIKTLNELSYLGFLYGLLTPSRAGEFVKAYYLSKESGISAAHSITSVFLDRVLDVVMLFLLVNVAVIYLPYFLGREVLSGYTWLLPAATLLFALSLYALSRERVLGKVIDFMEKYFNKLVKKDPYASKAGGASREFHETLRNLKKGKKGFLPVLPINFVLWFFILLQAHVLLIALGAEVDIVYTFLAVPFAIMAALLPVTVSGLGTRDVAMVALFSLVGIPASKAVSLALLYLFMGQIVPALVGEYFYLRRGYSKLT
ncbi:MAG: flippase-like domain-containing protein [Candidatus Altiarchaeota archaeon]|nr:flippase-like domain-containing protein [Candidatus Altiarchaeota archaeon]